VEPGGSLPHLQEPATWPCPEPAQSQIRMYILYFKFFLFLNVWTCIKFSVKGVHNAHTRVTVLDYKLNHESYLVQSKQKTAVCDIHMYLAHKLIFRKLQDFLQVFTNIQMALASAHKQNDQD
jgi:hypothetical protein